MKTQFANFLLFRLLLFFAFFLSSLHLQAQEKITMTFGAGVPEMINFGLQYQVRNTRIGLSAGYLKLDYADRYFAGNADYYFHFGGQSKKASRKPWYLRTGIQYLRNEFFGVYNYWLTNFRVGREFHFNKDFGFFVEPGFALQIYFYDNDPGSAELLPEPIVAPGLGFGLFYQFRKNDNR